MKNLFDPCTQEILRLRSEPVLSAAEGASSEIAERMTIHDDFVRALLRVRYQLDKSVAGAMIRIFLSVV